MQIITYLRRKLLPVSLLKHTTRFTINPPCPVSRLALEFMKPETSAADKEDDEFDLFRFTSKLSFHVFGHDFETIGGQGNVKDEGMVVPTVWKTH